MTIFTTRPMRISAVMLLALMALEYVPLKGHRTRSILRSVRSLEANRADRDAHAGGYYAGLIDGGPEAGRDDITRAIVGRPAEKQFHEIDVTRYLRGDFLQFELEPDRDEMALGARFTTNHHGLRDRPYVMAKPEGTYRIALLGSSMDMGWGVGTDETYENRLEDWLNAHAMKRGIGRRFEVLNFSVPAYSPLHRLESFRRKARDYQPDMVMYAATMLDLRLLEIHIVNMLVEGLDPPYPFVTGAMEQIGVTTADLKHDKDALKNKVRPYLWEINEATLADLQARCRSEGLPLAMLIVPRVGEDDAPRNRGASVSMHSEIARRLGLPLLDLTATFDDRDPAKIEMAAWDNHPNALGHKLLFQALARGIAADATLYRDIFGVDPPPP